MTDESSLRSAISGTDVTIEFILSSTNTISLSSALTAITHQVKINGYNQTGGSRVELQWTGGTSTTVEGLVLDTGSGGSTIEGLAIGH